MNDRKNVNDSWEKFNKDEFEKYSEVQIIIRHQFSTLEWRKRKSDGKLCIIELLENGKGYRIYEEIKSNVDEKEVFRNPKLNLFDTDY